MNDSPDLLFDLVDSATPKQGLRDLAGIAEATIQLLLKYDRHVAKCSHLLPLGLVSSTRLLRWSMSPDVHLGFAQPC